MLVSICFTCKRLFNGKMLAEEFLWGDSESDKKKGFPFSPSAPSQILNLLSPKLK